MHLTRCPHCHGRIDLHACIQDEAGRDLLALMAKTPRHLAMALLPYLTLFKPATRDLANTRALRLAEDALELTSDHYLLAAAMNETVEAIRVKRTQGEGQPLKNHNYLKSVLASIADRNAQTVPEKTSHRPDKKEPVQRDDNAAWREQMRRMGKDPDKLLSQFTPPGGKGDTPNQDGGND